ncbi:MAG: phosphoribosylanthranilate isomerase [Gaiellaceae bacterium]
MDAAAEAGVDLAGFILAAESPRRAPGVLEVPETMLSVAVFVGERQETNADLIQLYERENGHRSRDAVLYLGERAVAEVLDLPWESGDPGHLARVAAAAREKRVMLAGGLGPENVAAAIEQVRPWAVDAASALEMAPGIKDHERLRRFVQAARLVTPARA